MRGGAAPHPSVRSPLHDSPPGPAVHWLRAFDGRPVLRYCSAPQRETAGSETAQLQPLASLQAVVTKRSGFAFGLSTEKIASLHTVSGVANTRTTVKLPCLLSYGTLCLIDQVLL